MIIEGLTALSLGISGTSIPEGFTRSKENISPNCFDDGMGGWYCPPVDVIPPKEPEDNWLPTEFVEVIKKNVPYNYRDDKFGIANFEKTIYRRHPMNINGDWELFLDLKNKNIDWDNEYQDGKYLYSKNTLKYSKYNLQIAVDMKKSADKLLEEIEASKQVELIFQDGILSVITSGASIIFPKVGFAATLVATIYEVSQLEKSNDLTQLISWISYASGFIAGGSDTSKDIHFNKYLNYKQESNYNYNKDYTYWTHNHVFTSKWDDVSYA